MLRLLLAASLVLLRGSEGGLAAGPAPAKVSPAPASAAPASAAPAKDTKEVRYLALGDSFTLGTGSTPEESFPARLAEHWRGGGRQVALKNLGVNGYTTQRLIEAELPEVAGFQPTFVTLAIGANDIVHGSTEEAYREQVKKILKGLAAAGVAAGSLVAVPQPDWSLSPVASDFGRPEDIRKKIERFNAILREEVQAVGGRYVDLFPLMRKQAEAKMLAGDALHPSKRAYQEWADRLAEVLSSK